MAALHFILVSLVTLCISSIALALECHECGPGANNQCEGSSMGNITCDQLMDRCMSVKFSSTMQGIGSMSVEMRNCSNSMACDPQSQYYICDMMNMTGLIASCEVACCLGNLCEPSFVAPTTLVVFSTTLVPATPTTGGPRPTPTSTTSVLVASLSTILLAFVLNMSA